MTFKIALTSALAFFLLQFSYGQRNYNGYNFFGITGGISIFNINTKDFATAPQTGFIGGFTTRGAFRNNFDLIYGLSFSSAKLSVEGRERQGSKAVDIDYMVQGAQINFLGSYNIIVKHLSLEFGPVFNINGKLKLDKDQYQESVLTGYEELRARDIQDISKFDVRLAAGLTAGLEHFRLGVQYQYGLLNPLEPLNDKGYEKDDFSGNTTTLLLAAVVYF